MPSEMDCVLKCRGSLNCYRCNYEILFCEICIVSSGEYSNPLERAVKVLLTGATGFVGGGVAKRLQRTEGVDLRCATRSPMPGFRGEQALISSIDKSTDWAAALESRDLVIHAAALAHVPGNEIRNAEAAYRDVNVEGTLSLARQAAEAGVQRFLFISSIGVNGRSNERPFSEDDVPNPQDSYALSKLEAERGLWDISAQTAMEVVIIRPPLVYGAQAPGNFGSLVKWVDRGIPLPLGAIHNRRSLVALENLVDFIVICLTHPAAANQLFLAGDGQDVSTTDLLRGVGKAMGKPARLIPVPARLLILIATLLGKKAIAHRLLGSLQVDISKSRSLLGWEPPLTVEEGLERCFLLEDQC